MRQSIKVVMLPTEDKTYQVKQGGFFINDSRKYNLGKLEVLKCERVTSHGHAWNGNGIRTYINHLYITVSRDTEPIKEGDWFINELGELWKHNGKVEPYKGSRKIIATTDRSIKIREYTEEEQDKAHFTSLPIITLPQLQQSFLKEFVANPDGEWEVEYELKFGKNTMLEMKGKELHLKLNQDNTVNITSVEEKMYSREDVEKLLKEISKESYIHGLKVGARKEKITRDSWTAIDWIKENL